MSILKTIRQSTAFSTLRRLIARHPVAAFLVMIFTITPVFVLQTIWAPLEIWPNKILKYLTFGEPVLIDTGDHTR